jgi:hypothetical protein
MKDLVARLTSRKFLLAIFAVVIALGNNRWFHLTADQIDLIKYAILAFIGMEGAADVVTRYTNIPDVQDPETTESDS